MTETPPPPTPIRPRDTSDDAEYRPFISFEGREGACPSCEDREFVRGYEAGLLYARLEAKPPDFHGTYHSENSDMLTRVAEALGYVAGFTSSGVEGWVFGAFTKKPAARRLSVVPKEES